MSLRHLRPQAEGALRGTSASGVQRDIRILAIGAVVPQIVEVLFVDLGHERQRVQFLAGQNRAIGIMLMMPLR